jgi:sodium transport system permease protein
MNAALTVLLKELRDALRDRRMWMIVLVSSLVAGPVSLLLISRLVTSIEERAAKREIVVSGIERAPSLVNFLQRAGATVLPAPPDYAAQLRSGELQNAVVVVPADFETKLAAGEALTVEVLYDDSHDKAQPIVRAAIRTVAAFNRELGTQRLLARGVSPQLLAAIEVDEQNLAAAGAQGARILFVVPWVALLVAVAGCISVAIDVSAGERERGSLEPLLMHPLDVREIVIGKWVAVALCATAVALLTIVGFIGATLLVRSETLSALLQFGPRQIGVFALMIVPFAALMAAVNMLAATFGRTFKEAQTYVSYITMLVNFAPIVPLFLTVRDAPWQLAVPALGQMMVLMRALRGDTVGTIDLVLPAVVCAVGIVLCLALQARLLRREAIIYARS